MALKGAVNCCPLSSVGKGIGLLNGGSWAHVQSGTPTRVLKQQVDHADCVYHIVSVQMIVSLGGDVKSLALSHVGTIIQNVGDV